MKIGLISTAYAIPTPPTEYGGMERLNHALAVELVKQGVDLTLFGCKGSYLNGGTVVELPGGGECVPREGGDYPPFFQFMLDWMQQQSESFDVWHDAGHHHEFARRMESLPHLCTIYNPNSPESTNNVFISDFHRIHMGFPKDPFVRSFCNQGEFIPDDKKEDYALFIGALGQHKGFDRAVKFSIQYQIPLKIAGHPTGQPEIEALEEGRKHPWIEYLGSVGGEQKVKLFSKAKAILTPFRWPEPGAVVGPEAMASGTPIISSRAGVMPEYVNDGVTGFLCDGSPEEMKTAWDKIDTISPDACYQRYLQHFTTERAANEYLGLYDRVIAGDKW